MKSNRILMTIFSLVVIASMALTACGGGGAGDSGKTKIGLPSPILRPNAGRMKKC